jgi:ribosomal protein S18 acetylase RimI-like enzyme
MEDLYVKPEFRGNKIGTQLWKAVTPTRKGASEKKTYLAIY